MASFETQPLCLKCSRSLILTGGIPPGSGPVWTCFPCELTFTREQLATFKPGDWAAIQPRTDLGAIWEPADRLGLLYQLELACRVLEGSVPVESVDIEGLTGYIRRRAGMARDALSRAGLLPEEG